MSSHTASTPMPPSRRRSFKVLILIILALSAVGLWWWLRPAQGPAYRTVAIERGDLTATIAASGQVMPVTQVTVGSQVSGQIRELFVDFNSEVKAGQLIAQIDPQLIEFQVRQAQADLQAARSQVLIAQANVQAAQASVSKAQVDVDQAKRDLARQQDLVSKGFIAASEADRAQSLVNTSTQLLRGAQAQASVVAAQVQAAQATVLQREAALAQAQTNLSRTKITSPVDGIVIKRAVERGQTVAASLQAPELFVIAQNLQDMRVEVSVDESDVGRIQPGQKATFTVDAFPGQTFEGKVDQVRKAPVNANNVVTYVAAVNFANTSGKLLPGMTANVRIVTDTRLGVLKIPNAALRVRIPDKNASENIAKNQINTSDNGQKIAGNSVGDADVKTATQTNVSAKTAGTKGRVWVLAADGKRPQTVEVRLGLTDGNTTELLSVAQGAPSIAEGTVVITGTVSGDTKAGGNSARGGRAGGGPRLPF